MKKFLTGIQEHLELVIGSVCLCISLTIGFLNVVTRYVFSYSAPWAEEFLRYLCYWMCFGGAAHAFHMGANVGVEFVVGKLGPRAGRVMEILIKLVTIAYFLLIVVYGWQIVLNKYHLGQVSPAGHIPVWIPYFALPFGGVLVVIRLCCDIYQLLKGTGQKEDTLS